MAIHISNHTMRREDRGVVVVGGSEELGDLAHQGAAGVPPLRAAVQPGRQSRPRGSLGALRLLDSPPMGNSLLSACSRPFPYSAGAPDSDICAKTAEGLLGDGEGIKAADRAL